MTAGNRRKTPVPVFTHRPGPWRLASGRTRRNVLNVVLAPIRLHGKCANKGLGECQSFGSFC